MTPGYQSSEFAVTIITMACVMTLIILDKPEHIPEVVAAAGLFVGSRTVIKGIEKKPNGGSK